jgi:hypothetical protein
MSSVQTDKNNESKKQIRNDWMPGARVKTKSVKQTDEEMEAEFKKMLNDGVLDGVAPKRNVTEELENSVGTDDILQSKERSDNADSLHTELTKSEVSAESSVQTAQTVSKRTSGKQRKESLEEYRETFLQVPKLEDRKPIFISREVRDQLDEIVRRLGGRRMSLSGFIENLSRHHLEIYKEDVEAWKKL